jgi:Protein of unknown function (DUF3131)
MNSDFDPPPKKLLIIVSVGGIVTAFVAIMGLNYWSKIIKENASAIQASEVNKSIKKQEVSTNDPVGILDTKSIVKPGNPIINSQITEIALANVTPKVTNLSPGEIEVARQAWSYFQRNWNDTTGLVNSTDNFQSVTMWDQAAAIAALVSARELNLVSKLEFETKMEQMLKTLASLPLYKGELPNKVYNSKTLLPVNYGKLDERQEVGWSAIDLGRMAIWLKIVGAKYPKFQTQTEKVWKSWKVERLTKDGQMYGTSVIDNKEQYNQEGRLGYENYAAYGLKLWGLNVEKALDYKSKAEFVNLYGQGIPYDRREFNNSGANNYVLSEPYILDGIETGFKSLPKVYADRILAAQEARYQKTNQLTAVTEDNLDRAPYFVYNSLYVNGEPWSTITDTRQKYNNLRFVSAKAAIGWYVLNNTEYTRKLFNFVNSNLKTDKGLYNGYYEVLKEPNRALTANNNGVILQSLLYKKVGQPLVNWAGVKPSK